MIFNRSEARSQKNRQLSIKTWLESDFFAEVILAFAVGVLDGCRRE